MMMTSATEPCRVCGGTRWIAEYRDSSKSMRCPFCDEKGNVLIHLPEDFVALPDPEAPKARKPAKTK